MTDAERAYKNLQFEIAMLPVRWSYPWDREKFCTNCQHCAAFSHGPSGYCLIDLDQTPNRVILNVYRMNCSRWSKAEPQP